MAHSEDEWHFALAAHALMGAGLRRPSGEYEMRVIAKAYRDRPLDRSSTGTGAEVIYLVDASHRDAIVGSRDGVGFPRSAVFRFEDSLFRSLADAWEAGDMAELARLWERAIPVADDE